MNAYALFQEYIWLVNTIHRFGRLTLEEINQRWLDTELSEGIPIARSTFNRHRDAILDMFGIIIECDRKDGFRYYIFNEEVLEEDTIQNWMLSTLSVNSILSESKAVQKRILLESIPSDGDNLHKFIDAMKRGVRVKVNYRRYGAEASKSAMKLDPYFVKLFNKRWYALVKFPEPTAFLFTLAFDRIISLEVTDEKYEYDKDFDPSGWFKECYGIVRDPGVPVEKVVIRAYGRRWSSVPRRISSVPCSPEEPPSRSSSRSRWPMTSRPCIRRPSSCITNNPHTHEHFPALLESLLFQL